MSMYPSFADRHPEGWELIAQMRRALEASGGALTPSFWKASQAFDALVDAEREQGGTSLRNAFYQEFGKWPDESPRLLRSSPGYTLESERRQMSGLRPDDVAGWAERELSRASEEERGERSGAAYRVTKPDWLDGGFGPASPVPPEIAPAAQRLAAADRRQAAASAAKPGLFDYSPEERSAEAAQDKAWRAYDAAWNELEARRRANLAAVGPRAQAVPPVPKE